MRGSGNPKIPELSQLDLRTACRKNYYFSWIFLSKFKAGYIMHTSHAKH
jgi:hypothetical protein